MLKRPSTDRRHLEPRGLLRWTSIALVVASCCLGSAWAPVEASAEEVEPPTNSELLEALERAYERIEALEARMAEMVAEQARYQLAETAERMGAPDPAADP